MKRTRLVCGLLSAATLLAAGDILKGATLYWDADANAANGAGGGNGTWNLNTTANWYDGVSADVKWTANNDAVFGSTGGTVSVTGNVNPGTMTFNVDGYTINNNVTLQTAVNSLTVKGNTTFNGLLNFPTSGTANIDSTKTLTLAGGGSPRTLTGGTVSVTGGNLSIGQIVANTTLLQTGGIATTSSSSQTPQIGSGATGSWTLNNASAALTASTGNALDVGRGTSGNGTLTINNGSVSLSGGVDLRIGVSNNAVGVVNVSGGTLSVTGTDSYVHLADGSNQASQLNISAGIATIDNLQFGRDGQSSGGSGKLTVTGGSLYVGSGGIVRGVTGKVATIELSGGTVGASADWSSPLAMTLNTGTGAITFKAADADGTAHNITLSGVLSGAGGLTKSGGGTLFLNTGNSYSGDTTVSAGTLLAGNSSGSATGTGNVEIASGATLGGSGIIDPGSGKTVTNYGSIALSGGGSTLSIGSAGSANNVLFKANSKLLAEISNDLPDVLAITGSLDLSQAGDVLEVAFDGTQNLTRYVLLTYTGTLNGSFDSLSVTGSAASWRIDDSQAGEIAIVVPEPAAMTLLGLGAVGLMARRRRPA